MQQQGAVRAVIDIGSNTIEVLVARCTMSDLEVIEHQTTMARLGEGVEENGEISRDKFDTALDAIRKFKELAQQRGAEQILALATEAMREARNSQDFLDAVKRETGLEVQIISGSAEAVLDYYGATYDPGTPLNAGVLDVGGGSTEIVTAKNTHVTWLTSIPIGSGSIHDRYLPSDPPAYKELEAARSYLAKYLQTIRVPEAPPALVVTGSSASALLKLVQRAFKMDEQSDRLTQEDLSLAVGLLGALPAEEIAQRFEQKLERARILAAGALIMQAVMNYLHLDEIHVSSHGVREGALLAYTRYGERWLEEVNGIASKYGQSPDQDAGDRQDEEQQPFAEFGRDILPKYAKKMLKWPDAILSQGDIEAVHKMRVATRNLRAALEALESCISPKAFKKLNRDVKNLADHLGTVRDTDVMIQGLRIYLQEVSGQEHAAGVQWLIDRLDSYHQQEKQALDTELQALDGNALRQQIESSIPKGAAQNG